MPRLFSLLLCALLLAGCSHHPAPSDFRGLLREFSRTAEATFDVHDRARLQGQMEALNAQWPKLTAALPSGDWHEAEFNELRLMLADIYDATTTWGEGSSPSPEARQKLAEASRHHHAALAVLGPEMKE